MFQLESIGQTLTRFLRFLTSTYDVTPPEHFLTVYLVESHHAVRQLADRLHGLDVSAATVGYAFVDDASVVAAVPGTAVGTVLHELFHLLVRADFGDIPQWLDEGIASLYEVSGRTEDRYFGLKNWRGRVLKELWHHRPSVEQLIRTEWFLFDDPEQARHVGPGRDLPKDFYDREEGSRQAATMAMSRYFMLYLEQRGELISVFRVIRDRGFADLKGDARDHAIDLVERTLGRTAEELDAEFVAWFRSGRLESDEAARRPLTEGDSTYRATANVYVRSGPSRHDNALALLPQGTRVAAFGKAGDWIEVRFDDGTVGYVSERYLSALAGQ